MSWKSFACVAALCVAVSPVLAAPSLSFVDNADGTGTFQITPDASLFGPSGGSIAFEIEATITAGDVDAASVNTTAFPRANPGDFTGGVSTGLNFTATLVTAAYGSDLFTTGTPVNALTIDLGSAGSLSYTAVVAQAGANNNFSGTGNITEAVALNPGDFNGDGRVDAGDLNLLLGNWGSATVPGTWINGFTPNVDAGELNTLLGNWGFGTAVAIPEPASVVLLSLAGVALCGARRNG